MHLVRLGEIPRDGRGGAVLGHARTSGDVGAAKSSCPPEPVTGA